MNKTERACAWRANIHTSRCPGFFPGHASFAYFFLRGSDSENIVGVVEEGTSCIVLAHKLGFEIGTCDSNASRGFSTGGATEKESKQENTRRKVEGKQHTRTSRYSPSEQ